MAAAKKGENRNPNGRPKGSKNKAVIERERLALDAMRSAGNRKAMGLMLAREVLADAMMAVWTLAEAKWKTGRKVDIEDALAYTVVAADIASKLAPYESPRLESVTIHKADPFDAMSDEQLYGELRARAQEIGLALPAKPVLIEGVANNDG